MPRILSYTPQWLSRPNPGYELFAAKPASGAIGATQEATGKRKTIATRGSEVFAAAGSEIRWADLSSLKEGTGSYRTLKVSVPLPITQIIVSPYGDYLAVSTSHTVHVAVLPDSSLLDADDTGPLKLKTFQIGPLAHVREESPLVSLLWHPLGYRGRCLVTITLEGVVRLWEVNRADRLSFSDPSLSIDLQKLANATDDQQDLSASKYGASKGFSPDSFELEVASACFGDFPEQEGVHGWAPMTLWVAMVEGDVYALCPLLPSKWQLQESTGSSTFIQTLTTSINSNHAEVLDNSDAPAEETATAEKQLSWLSDIIYQEPFKEGLPYGESIKVFSRPTSLPAIPLLQGPFSISPEVEEFEISDLIVFSLKTFSDGAEDDPAEGLPTAIVCLLTDTSKVHVCLDLEGIVGRWLPSSTGQFNVTESAEHSLVITETIALIDDDASTFSQSITADVFTDFTFYVSHASGVFYVSMESWIRKLESELSEPQDEGADFRLKRVIDSASTQVERCITRPARGSPSPSSSDEVVTSCVAVEDGNIGYMLLTAYDNEPQAVILDAPEDGLPTQEELAQYMDVVSLPQETRPVYQAPKVLHDTLQFISHIDQLVPSRHKASSKEEIKLSPANMDILMNAHKAMSQDTERLGAAVSDLFRRCEQLLIAFRHEVYGAAKMAAQVDSVTGNDEVQGQSESEAYGSARIEERLEKIKRRQEGINARYEEIRKKMACVGSSELSEKETQFVEELQTMERSLEKSAQTLTDDADGSELPSWERVEQVKGFQRDLTKQVEQAAKGAKEERTTNGVKVPSHSRKQEKEQIEALLQRESALVEAATNRLRSMGISIPLEGAS